MREETRGGGAGTGRVRDREPSGSYLWRWIRTVTGENGPDGRSASSVRLVLLALAVNANPDGSRCYPSIADLEQKTRLSRTMVCRALDIAEGQGWIRRHARFKKDGSPTSNLYNLFIPSPQRTLPQSTQDTTVVHPVDTTSSGTSPGTSPKPPKESCSARPNSRNREQFISRMLRSIKDDDPAGLVAQAWIQGLDTTDARWLLDGIAVANKISAGDLGAPVVIGSCASVSLDPPELAAIVLYDLASKGRSWGRRRFREWYCSLLARKDPLSDETAPDDRMAVEAAWPIPQPAEVAR